MLLLLHLHLLNRLRGVLLRLSSLLGKRFLLLRLAVIVLLCLGGLRSLLRSLGLAGGFSLLSGLGSLGLLGGFRFFGSLRLLGSSSFFGLLFSFGLLLSLDLFLLLGFRFLF